MPGGIGVEYLCSGAADAPVSGCPLPGPAVSVIRAVNATNIESCLTAFIHSSFFGKIRLFDPDLLGHDRRGRQQKSNGKQGQEQPATGDVIQGPTQFHGILLIFGKYVLGLLLFFGFSRHPSSPQPPVCHHSKMGFLTRFGSTGLKVKRILKRWPKSSG
jgi:hypothetical protein